MRAHGAGACSPTEEPGRVGVDFWQIVTQRSCHLGGGFGLRHNAKRTHTTHDMSNGDETVTVELTAEAEKIMEALEALRLGLGISKVEGTKL
eukprot:1967680-Prymnesium_polylepis.1